MAYGIDGMVGVTLNNNWHSLLAFPDYLISLFDLLLVVKIKPASCKCLFDKSFLIIVALSTPLFEEVVSHHLRACMNRV